jgi:hypothetical protein
MDRTQLPLPPETVRSGEIDPHRIRHQYHLTRHSGSVTKAVTRSSSGPDAERLEALVRSQ